MSQYENDYTLYHTASTEKEGEFGPCVGFQKATRKELYKRWQQRWDNFKYGCQIHTLILCIKRWVERKQGKLNYHLAQFLKGQGEYRKYLHRFGLDESPDCPECTATPKNPEPVIFYCPRFPVESVSLIDTLKVVTQPHNLVQDMLRK